MSPSDQPVWAGVLCQNGSLSLCDIEEERPGVWLQLGFFNIVGLPLFKAMAELFEEAQPMLEGVLANLRVWEQAADTPL